jgi:Tfp pilus assembly protein PilF
MQFPRWIRLALGVAVVAAAVAGCSRSAQSHLERGSAHLEKGNVDAALLEFRNAVEKDPMFAPARSPSPCARRTCSPPTRTPS